MNCTVCGEPVPCSAMRQVGEPAIKLEVAYIQAHPDEYPNLFTPTPSEKEQHNGR